MRGAGVQTLNAFKLGNLIRASDLRRAHKREELGMNALFRVSRPTIFLRTSQGRRSCLPKAHNSRRQPDQQKSPDSSQTDNPQDETFCLQSFFTFHDIGWCGQSESCLRNVFGKSGRWQVLEASGKRRKGASCSRKRQTRLTSKPQTLSTYIFIESDFGRVYN